MLFYIEEAPTNNCFLLSGAFQMFAINRWNKNFKLGASAAFSELCYIIVSRHRANAVKTIVLRGGFGVTALSGRARLG